MKLDHICLVTNRSVTSKGFGERTNSKGLGEVRIATARVDSNGIQLERFDEQAGVDSLPSQELFTRYLQEVRQKKVNVVLYVHGFNTSFEDSVREAWDIHVTYGVGVVLFSWPSNPGGLPPFEYKKARRAAAASSPAFDNTLEKLGLYMRNLMEQNCKNGTDCDVKFNLMCYSQGNYLLQRFVESAFFEGETRIFTNAIMMQADVDSEGHETWATASGRHRAFQRLYVTINEADWVLRKSQLLNWERLGCTADNLVGPRVRYVDFTRAQHIGDAHGFFQSNEQANRENLKVREFFEHVLNGRTPERELNLSRDAESGAWQVP